MSWYPSNTECYCVTCKKITLHKNDVIYNNECRMCGTCNKKGEK